MARVAKRGGSNAAIAADDEANSLGPAVRRLRRERNMSIAELARRAGVTAPFISQLESGKTSLSVPTLYRVASGLGCAPNALLPGSSASSLVIRPGAGPRMHATETPHTQRPRLLTRSGAGTLLEAWHYRIQQDDDPQDWYEHAGEDLVYLVSGRMEVEFADGRRVEVGAGDSFHHDGDVPHRWLLVGDEAVEAIIVLAIPPAPGQARET